MEKSLQYKRFRKKTEYFFGKRSNNVAHMHILLAKCAESGVCVQNRILKNIAQQDFLGRGEAAAKKSFSQEKRKTAACFDEARRSAVW